MSDDPNTIEPTSVQTSAEVQAATGTNLPATQEQAPEKWSWGGAIGGILNFLSLGLRILALAAAAAILKEQLNLLQRLMRKDAERARRLAEQLAPAGVDGRFQAQAHEVAAAFERVADASGEVAQAADQMEADAQGVKDAHDTEYGGIYEAVNASPYEQPKPGFTPASR